MHINPSANQQRTPSRTKHSIWLPDLCFITFAFAREENWYKFNKKLLIITNSKASRLLHQTFNDECLSSRHGGGSEENASTTASNVTGLGGRCSKGLARNSCRNVSSVPGICWMYDLHNSFYRHLVRFADGNLFRPSRLLTLWRSMFMRIQAS